MARLTLLLLASPLLVACGASEASAPKNAILICVDTLRADRLGCYGYELRETTPALDRWAARSTVFLDTCAPAGWTKPSVPSFLTGTYPLQHGVYEGSARGLSGTTSDVLPQEATTLAERFEQAGYRTAAFVRNAQLRAGLGFEQGFQTYADSAGDAREIRWRALDWLDEGKDEQPFFLYLHLLDVHMPYDVPDAWASRFESLERVSPFREDGWRELRDAVNDGERTLSTEERQALDAVYDGSLAYVDHQLGRLFEALERRGLAQDTVVALVSDHGEELGERGRIGHGHGLTEGLLQVPFVLHVPGAQARTHTGPVDLIDVYPSLLSAAGLGVADPWPATDRWLDPDAPAQLFAEHRSKNHYEQALRHERTKLVRRFEPELEVLAGRELLVEGARWEAELALGEEGELRVTRLKPREEEPDEPIELKGVLGGGSEGWSLAGIPVRLTPTVELQDPDETGLELAEGVYVKLKGEVVDGVFHAQRVKFYPTERERELELRGPLQHAGERVRIAGLELVLDERTTIDVDGEHARRLSLDDARALALSGEANRQATFELERDPLELDPLDGDPLGLARGLDRLAAALLRRARLAGGTVAVDEASLRALEAIGYGE